MDNIDDKKYDLTKKEYDECIAKAEFALFFGKDKKEHPKSYWIVAQPGAGKTALKQYVVRKNAKDLPDFVEFDSDELALYHKHREEILKEFPDLSYQILQRFTQPALDKHLRPLATASKFNLVQEGTFTSDAFMDVLNFQKNGGTVEIDSIVPGGPRGLLTADGGYFIDLNILAVNRYESLLSSYEREQDWRDLGVTSRVVIPEKHDNSYKKMLETTKEGMKRGFFDVIHVYRRGKVISNELNDKKFEDPTLIYTSGDGKYPDAITAVEYERRRQINQLLDDPKEYLARITALRQRINENGIVEQSERLDRLEAEFSAELENYKPITKNEQ